MGPTSPRRSHVIRIVGVAGLAVLITARGSAAEPGASRSAPEAGAAVRAPSAGSGAPGEASGAALYARYCALCHGPEAKGYAADDAPSLVSAEFLSAADDAFLARSIALGRPGTAMAAYGRGAGGPLDDAQIAKIVGFLRARGPAARPLPAHPPGSMQRGAAIYLARCQSCHGDRSTRGNAVRLSNPTFLGLASDAFLFDAVVRGRQGTPMRAFGGELTDAEIADVVAYLRSFGANQPIEVERGPAPDPSAPVVLNPDGGAPALTLREGRFVAVDDVMAAFLDERRMVIVDARAPSDWARERIPGAISLPYYDLQAVDRLPNDGTWVIAYCACPHHASGEVVDELRRRGFAHTAVLDEGIDVWRDRGYPVTSGAGAPPGRASTPPAP